MTTIEHRITPLINGAAGANTAYLTTNTYDEFGRILTMIDAGPETDAIQRTTKHDYSRIGLTETVTDRNGVATTSISDAAGQVREIDKADTSKQTFAYDQKGNQTLQKLLFAGTTGDFRQTVTTYDALDRPTLVSRSGQSTYADNGVGAPTARSRIYQGGDSQ